MTVHQVRMHTRDATSSLPTKKRTAQQKYKGYRSLTTTPSVHHDSKFPADRWIGSGAARLDILARLPLDIMRVHPNDLVGSMRRDSTVVADWQHAGKPTS